MVEEPITKSSPSHNEERPVLLVTNARKSFGGLRAVDDVTFELRRAEIHAIVGENGAGKSTLIKLITGAHQPDSGTIEIAAHVYQGISADQARALGVAVVYQEFTLLPELTVAENIFLGAQPRNAFGLVDIRGRRNHAQELLSRLGVTIDANRLVRTLTVGEQQIVEVAKALAIDAHILIMDEPSAVLPTNDLDRLFELVRTLRGQGTSIIYISHRLAEIYELADRVTVMKDGRSVATVPVGQTSRSALVEMMVGRPLSEQYPHGSQHFGKPVLKIRDLAVDRCVSGVTFECREGEIVGLAGLGGSGRTTVCRAIVGLARIDSGDISCMGISPPRDPHEAATRGIVLIPEDRARHGLVLGKPISFNVSLPWLTMLQRLKVILDLGAELRMVKRAVRDFGVRPPDAGSLVDNLSGGNQQKVVLGKWLALTPKLIVLDEPTRGIDVGARADIYKLIRSFAEQGIAIVMASSDLPEILGMSDRVIVLHEGRQVGDIQSESATEQLVMHLATGEPTAEHPIRPDQMPHQ
jgi:ABC-type sugar transport system ATPase subunit